MDLLDDTYLRFRRGPNEAILDSITDYKLVLAQYGWLSKMYTSDQRWKDVVFQGPGIERIVAIEGRNYMTFQEIVRAFHLYCDAMWRFTYYPLDMTGLDHNICSLIDTFCNNDLSSNNYKKWYIPSTYNLQLYNHVAIQIH